jgi:septation ring formation regulator EzrA
MSAEQDRVRALAERIAQRVSQSENVEQEERTASSPRSDELADVRESLAELKRKLYTIEEHLSRERESESSSRQNQEAVRPPLSTHSPWLSGVYVPAAHPSQERFGVEEAAVSELVDFFEKEKVCELEPGGKPCTHCDMCSTRGF